MRLAEVLAALSLGIDVGFGQPMGHVLRLCRIALRLAELTGADPGTRAAAYHAALLVNVACHGDGHELTRWFGDDMAVLSGKYDHEPFSVREVVAMLGMLGAGPRRPARLSGWRRLRRGRPQGTRRHDRRPRPKCAHTRQVARLPPPVLAAVGGSPIPSSMHTWFCVTQLRQVALL